MAHVVVTQLISQTQEDINKGLVCTALPPQTCHICNTFSKIWHVDMQLDCQGTFTIVLSKVQWFPHPERITFGRYVLVSALGPSDHLLSPLPEGLVQRLQLLHVHGHVLILTDLLLDLLHLC